MLLPSRDRALALKFQPKNPYDLALGIGIFADAVSAANDQL
jgi:hypothetical protein